MEHGQIGRASRWAVRVVLALVIAVGVGYLPYQAYGPRGVGRALRLEREYRDLRRDNDRIKRENAMLRSRILRMRRDPREAERVARDELGLVRPGDRVFQFEQ